MNNAPVEQIAYETYAAHQGWKNHEGNPIPPWDEQREDIKAAWRAAIMAALEVKRLNE